MRFFDRKKKFLKQFEDLYGIQVPEGCRIERSGRNVIPGRFLLRLPHWKYAKADGTRDRRVHDNELLMDDSVLWIGDVRVLAGCFDMVDLVGRLRRSGVAISLCAQEQEKLKKRSEEWNEAFREATLEKIVARFEKNPTRFESYCAMLLEQLGYRTHVTPPVNDGGYDIRLYENDVLYGLVECKLYNPASKVSRPIIQKLVGANELERAPHLFVITTSCFTKEAAEFAEQADVRLIGGEALCELIKKAVDHEEAPLRELAEFTKEDLLPLIAADIDCTSFTSGSVSGR